jgi:hypothetical protein
VSRERLRDDPREQPLSPLILGEKARVSRRRTSALIGFDDRFVGTRISALDREQPSRKSKCVYAAGNEHGEVVGRFDYAPESEVVLGLSATLAPIVRLEHQTMEMM